MGPHLVRLALLGSGTLSPSREDAAGGGCLQARKRSPLETDLAGTPAAEVQSPALQRKIISII